MPGRHINDHQMRLYMKSRLTEKKPAAAAQAAISLATAYRIENDPRLPSQKPLPRGRRRPDPLVNIFDPEIVPMLEATPGLRPIAIFEEMQRRHPELPDRVRRTMERRIRQWRALERPRPGGDFPSGAGAGADGIVGFYRDGRSGGASRGGRARSPAVPLPVGLLGLRARACHLGRRELRGPGRGAAERAVGTRWSTARAPQRQFIGGVPQSRQRCTRGSDQPLRCVVCALPDGTDPQ